ncbi:DJ-1/PfpI family protein [Pseudoroseomonas globiformis]|uniref:DJ-1/PfpI family protein n=1 Tax=Teichococcus globiformis TaxID=2307229 RepID=A0ABV7G4M2_9PROT
MAGRAHARILILATDGSDLGDLMQELRRQGAELSVAAPVPRDGGDSILSWDGQAGPAALAKPVPVDHTLETVQPGQWDALVLPDGLVGPDRLRAEPEVLALLRDWALAGGMVAAIGHGAWVLVDAGLAKGRRMTSCPAIRTDLQNAGALWLDLPVVQDGPIITVPPAGQADMLRHLQQVLAEGRHAGGTA